MEVKTRYCANEMVKIQSFGLWSVKPMSKKLLLITLTLIIITFATPTASAMITPSVEEVTDTGTMGTWSFSPGTYKKYGTDHFDSTTWTYSSRPVQVISYTFPSDGYLTVEENLDGNSIAPLVDLWIDGQRVSIGEMGIYYRGRLKQGQVLEFYVYPMYNAFKSDIVYDDPGSPPLIFEGVYDAQSGSVTYTFESESDTGGSTSDYVSASFSWYPMYPTTADTLSVEASVYTTGTITSYLWFVDSNLEAGLTSDSWTWENPPAGEHMVTLIVKDSNGNTDSHTDYITVVSPAQITPQITMTPQNPTTATPVNLVDSSVIEGALGFTQYWYLDEYLVDYATGQTAWTWEEPTEGEHTIQLELYDGEDSYYADIDFTVTSASEITVDIETPSTAYVGSSSTINANIVATGTQVGEIHWYINDVSEGNIYNAESWTWTPSTAGVHTIAVSVIGADGRYASDSVQVTVEDRPLVNLLITDKNGVPLPEIGISLTTVDQMVDDTWTGKDGKVVFQTSPVVNDGVDYYVQVQFIDKPLTFLMYDEQSSTTELAYMRFGPYQFKALKDYNMTIKALNAQDSSKTKEVETHREDLVEMYIRFYQAARFFDTEYFYTFNTKPLPIYTHVTSDSGVYFWENSIHPFGNPPTTDYPCIVIEKSSSSVSQPDAPMNREWHEFSHYFQWDQYGELPPNHYNVVNKKTVWLDENHNGVKNHCTSDSFTEAFAEFSPLFMQIEYGTRTSGFAHFGIGTHYSYPVEDSHIMYELNYPRDKWEELAISSLLFDLWDGVDAKDHDHIQIDYDTIMELLMWKHELSTYYQLDQTTGKVELIEDADQTSERHVHYVSDIYDLLIENQELFEITQDQVDELFAYHGFYYDADGSGTFNDADYISAGTPSAPERRNFVIAQDKTMTVKSSGVGELVVDVVFPGEFSEYDYSYSVPLESKDKEVGLIAPPEYYNATVYMSVYEDNEPSKDSYSITSNDYWDKVETGNGIGSYSFQSSGSGLDIVSMGMLAGKIIAGILIVLMALGFLRQNGII